MVKEPIKGPMIDRRVFLSQERLKRRFNLLLTVLLSLSLATIALLLVQLSGDAPRELTTPVRTNRSTHVPIEIIGDAGFLGLNASTGIGWGSGTASDPYVIADWDINASTADGIHISSSDVQFVIRNCWIYGGNSTLHSGISIYNCVNGTLIGNNCSYDSRGISLEFHCKDITVINNTCFSNLHEGISVMSSDNITVNGNTCSNNNLGIWASGSRNTLSNNTCDLNYYSGVYLVSADNSTIRDNICSNAGYGIGIWYCRNLSLINNTCTSITNYGVWIDVSHNNAVIDNCACNNSVGIESWLSDWNIVSDNNCSGNAHNGIHLSDSNNSALIDNNCLLNGRSGIYLEDSSCNNSLTDNTCSSNGLDGIRLESTPLPTSPYPDVQRDNRLIGNTCISNLNSGIALRLSDYNYIANNTCAYNGCGITLTDANSNDLVNNTCANNSCGLFIDGGSYDMVQMNRMENNTAWGINCAGSHCVIWNNTFYHNNGAGDTYDHFHLQARDAGVVGPNSWNSPDGYGNWWSDWTSPDADMDGIVDNPYPGVPDNYPKTTYGTVITEFGSPTVVPCIIIAVMALMAGWGRRNRRKLT